MQKFSIDLGMFFKHYIIFIRFYYIRIKYNKTLQNSGKAEYSRSVLFARKYSLIYFKWIKY